MVDAAWAGVVGAVVGGAIGSLTSLFAPLINWRVESKRIGLEHQNELEKLDRQRELDERNYKRGLIVQWRLGIASLSGEHTEALGTEWYETLRPKLDKDVRRYFERDRQTIIPDSEVRGAKNMLAEVVDEIEEKWGLD
ncbi:hypothetical protein WSS_A15174 [Rhodococcus opacus M213]|uniref:Uncharacterized protein n=1 Tax=Rhodococcus opacus M213 TaxID=1129896 RepID=K8XXC0_RHOOP|nr:hypothetical protein [Rhodococcus opacus]EKT81845.1 hypothetical protein WSS_A15174 [Rhodococcus opacus M213]